MKPSLTSTLTPPIQVPTTSPSRFSVRASRTLGRPISTPWAMRARNRNGFQPFQRGTNPLKPDMSGLAVGCDTSVAEQIAAWAPGAREVKIFNTTGFKNMDDPKFGEARVTMFYCGDDAEAKKVAAGLAEDLGFEPVDAGPLSEARSLEPLAFALDPPRLCAEDGAGNRVQADAAVASGRVSIPEIRRRAASPGKAATRRRKVLRRVATLYAPM
jgi:hypothetical protein